MSFNMCLAFIPNSVISEFMVQADDRVSTDEAIGGFSPHPAAAQIGAHVLLAGPNIEASEIPPMSDPRRGAVRVMLGGTSDVYVVETFGENPRLRVLQSHELVEDQGDPLAAESVFEDEEDPEDAHLKLIYRLAGISAEEFWELQWAPPLESPQIG